jgi:hypothetical protein
VFGGGIEREKEKGVGMRSSSRRARTVFSFLLDFLSLRPSLLTDVLGDRDLPVAQALEQRGLPAAVGADEAVSAVEKKVCFEFFFLT